MSATGGCKFNAIATINDFQMICDLFLGAKFSSTLEIEFEKEKDKKKTKVRSLSRYDGGEENTSFFFFFFYVGRRIFLVFQELKYIVLR